MLSEKAKSMPVLSYYGQKDHLFSSDRIVDNLNGIFERFKFQHVQIESEVEMGHETTALEFA